MINRRNFIKLAGLTAVSLGGGYGSGKLFSNNDSYRFAVYGFFPEDKNLINKIISCFLETVNSKFSTSFNNNFGINKLPGNFENTWQNNSLEYYRYVSLKIKRLAKNIDSDLIISDSKNSIFSLENDFPDELLLLRQSLAGTKAKLFLSIGFRKVNLFSFLLNSEKKQVIIENESGVFDKIPSAVKYKNIVVPGPQGETVVEINDGAVKINRPACRQKLCKQAGFAINPGDVIACAPNKVLIRTEEA